MGKIATIGQCTLLIAVTCCLMAGVGTAAEPLHYDVVVAGATPGGLTAAVAAARAGLSVAVFEPSNHIGGVVSGGLTATDCADRRTVGGLTAEFFQRVYDYYVATYGADSPNAQMSLKGYHFEPRVAEQVFGEMLAEAGDVTLRLQHPLYGVQRARDRLERATFHDEQTGEDLEVTADIYIDALYEGDLLALAGVGYRVGAEGRHEYGEPHAWGEPSLQVQAYNYRLCLTDDPENQVMVEPPAGYDPATYRDLLAYLKQAEPARFDGDCFSLVPMPNRKVDANAGAGWQSSDYVGQNWEYPGEVLQRRRDIARAHRDYITGLLYFVQNDPEVPESVRAEARRWGLPRDEFTDNGHFPHALYVREARRMLGMHLFTELDATERNAKPRSVAAGDYAIDSHGVYVTTLPDGTTRPHGGSLYLPVRPYDIPYGVVAPRNVTNLLVAVCVSASHIGYGTLRMEPVYMKLGQVCGEAAALARQTGKAVQEVDVEVLRQRLAANGQVLQANRRPVAAFRVAATLPLLSGTPVLFNDASTDPDGRIVNWYWDFDGDGEVDAREANPGFTFTHTMSYPISLRVRDDHGDLSDIVVQQVPVTGGPPGVPPVVVDDDDAELTGAWNQSGSNPGYVGAGYRHDGNANKGSRQARYALRVSQAGRYDLALSYTHHSNRASNVPVTVRSAEGEAAFTLDQRQAPEARVFHVLGTFSFTPDAEGSVEISNAGTDGYVVIDAVRLTWAEAQE